MNVCEQNTYVIYKKESIFVDVGVDGMGKMDSTDMSTINLVRGGFEDYLVRFFGRKRVKTKVCPITPGGKFHIGLWNEFKKFSENSPIKFVFSEAFKKATMPKIEGISIQKIDGFEYYDYQASALNKMMQFGRGIVEIGTSGGKSLILAGFCKSILEAQKDKRILIIVPGLNLLDQLYGDFQTKYGLKDSTTFFTASRIRQYREDAPIVIANTETLITIEETLEIFKNFDYVLVDECHTINKDVKITNFIAGLLTFNKFGFTGTLPDVKIHLWSVYGRFGPVIYRKSGHGLREAGYISKVRINVAKLEHDLSYGDLIDPREKYVFEKEYLMRMERRNAFIKKLAKSLNKNCLILVDRIEHGNILYSEISSEKECYFINGAVPSEDRDEIKKRLEEKDDICVIAIDRIFSTGISINNLHHIIFVGIGKSKIKVIQSIGRSLRKNNNKLEAVLYDLVDTTHFSKNHYKKRSLFYKKEKIPFVEKIFKL